METIVKKVLLELLHSVVTVNEISFQSNSIDPLNFYLN